MLKYIHKYNDPDTPGLATLASIYLGSVCVCEFVCVCVCLCVYACECIHMYVYIHVNLK